MKNFFAFVILLFCLAFAFGQNEQAPILEKEINYKNWKYSDTRTGQEVSLRDFTKGKKLVIVIYYAPWCHNWQHDAPMVEKFYEKYKGDGLGVIAVGEYDTVDSMKTNLDAFKIAFPAVHESESRDAKQKTLHYGYRTSTGDTRGWGSPYYVFLTPSALEKKGDTLTKKTFIINGEMIDTEGEKFIREKLGLPEIEKKNTVSGNGKIEACDPDRPAITTRKKP